MHLRIIRHADRGQWSDLLRGGPLPLLLSVQEIESGESFQQKRSSCSQNRIIALDGGREGRDAGDLITRFDSQSVNSPTGGRGKGEIVSVIRKCG